MNNRLFEANQVQSEGKMPVTGFEKGDYSTPEEYVPEEGLPENADWEVCMTLNGTWGYSAWNKNRKSFETVLRALTDTVSKGGNFLLNIGPRADGSIPEEAVTVPVKTADKAVSGIAGITHTDLMQLFQR